MKIIRQIACLLLCLMLAGFALAETPAQSTDFAGQLRLNMASETVKTEATVKTFVDGDTTHFLVPESVAASGVLRARYLAVNTPETTGKVEEYGKKAAAFTKEKLTNAESIILESDDGKWNLDSTGGRHLVWVWYKPAEESDYRCLNLELLQNGLAIANSTANNRYGSTCMAALNQARAEKLHLYSGQKDPDFYYGEAVELTLRELRTNVEAYNGMKVAFNGIVTMNRDQSVYVETFDPETGLYFGMPVYYGYGMSGAGLDILSVGNEVRIVGTLQYYEAGGTWQVSGLTYRMMKPNDPGNIQKISDGHSAAYAPVDAETFIGQTSVETEEGSKTFPWAQLALGTSVSIAHLTVEDAVTTLAEDSSSYGAITLRCTSGGAEVTVRTEPMYENGTLITQDRYLGKTISVKGVVDFYDGAYQIRALTPEHITIE
ncbi:MAG: thermonuclease family protein [Clostridia bacterium]|nr:thermonuclease family protein [Clostridia bacterium]